MPVVAETEDSDEGVSTARMALEVAMRKKAEKKKAEEEAKIDEQKACEAALS